MNMVSQRKRSCEAPFKRYQGALLRVVGLAQLIPPTIRCFSSRLSDEHHHRDERNNHHGGEERWREDERQRLHVGTD